MNSSSILVEPSEVAEVHAQSRDALRHPKEAPPKSYGRGAEWILLGLAAIFFVLHFVHLRADFPNHSAWMDWAKYTDEGWYGDAAIRHYDLGHWYVPGDFNPAAALPVWPLLELILFRFTGVSLVAARVLSVSVFGLTLLCCYFLLRRWPEVSGSHGPCRSFAPSIAVLLLAVSPFCFVFSRLAILEPLLILLTFTALLVASRAGSAATQHTWQNDRRSFWRSLGWSCLLGLMLPAAILTKTTAVFLVPSILYMLWGASGNRFRPFLRSAIPACMTAVLTWGAYFLLYVRPHYLIDYQYLFSANAYTGITAASFWPVLRDTFTDGAWMGRTLYGAALVSMVWTLAWMCRQRFRGNPLPGSLLLWILGYSAFLAYHDNLQPRYYVVIAVPLTALTAVAFDELLRAALQRRPGVLRLVLRGGVTAGVAALLIASVAGAYYTIYFVTHPEYTFLSAIHRVQDTIRREDTSHAGHSPLLLSISGSEISLVTGLPSICDDFGTMALPDRVATYKPGWFATWNDVEDDKMDALAPMYHLVRVLAVPAFDDPERNQLILYRLDPLALQGRGRGRRRRSFLGPKRLHTRLGEQPTNSQLDH